VDEPVTPPRVRTVDEVDGYGSAFAEWETFDAALDESLNPHVYVGPSSGRASPVGEVIGRSVSNDLSKQLFRG
jgi:hypothetical protein